jgi:hypothetical protein
VVAALTVTGALAACGDSEESGADALARQHELANARHQAAQDARQAAHVKELQREVAALKHRPQADAGPTTESSAAAPVEESQAPGDWPGGSGYTAILASLSTEAEARERQREATSAGLDAGVLFSSDFSSLRPGYWVVFSGDFASSDGADARTARAKELGYADAYPRFVAP